MNAGKPMTDAGSLYLFACHLLYTAAHSYYGFRDYAAISMSQISHHPWNSIAEDIMGWTIEEIAFSLNREKVPADQARNVEDFAEIRDRQILQQINERIVESAIRLNHTYPAIGIESYVYTCYCRFLFRVLVEFGMMMDDKRMRQSRYFEHYRRDVALFKALTKELEKEFASDGDMPAAVTSGIEATAVALCGDWRQAIFAAAAEVFAS